MKTRTVKQITKAFFLALIVVSCSSGPKSAQDASQDGNQLAQQTVNAVIWYSTSAENTYIFEQTYHYATERLRYLIETAPREKPRAVILDLDETVLDNSPYMIDLIKNGKTYDELSWAEWVTQENATILPGVKSFLQECLNHEVEVFFVSNRSVKLQESTLNNLMNEGVMTDLDHLLLRVDESDKTERRFRVKNQFEVLLTIGDNLLDFDEIFRERSRNYGKQEVAENLNDMLPNHILLPNPMYGQWEKVFKIPEGASPSEKASKKIEQTNKQDY